jgi:uncharacterized protein YjbI with pentapeptide repeats
MLKMLKTIVLTSIFLCVLCVVSFAQTRHCSQLRFTKHVLVYDECIELKDGLKLSNMDLTGIRINRYTNIDRDLEIGDANELKNIDFSNSLLDSVDFRGTIFVNCSFKNAILRGYNWNWAEDQFKNCDFTGATISAVHSYEHSARHSIFLPVKNILTTSNFKYDGSFTCAAFRVDLTNIDFSGFRLANSSFRKIDGCRLDNAKIEHCKFYTISKEQFSSTSDFKSKFLLGIVISEADFRGIDLSDFTITQCRFEVDFKDANFSNAVITGSDFRLAENLTVAQIKSTWNYKHNQMDKIILPKDIQDELDKEKKK